MAEFRQAFETELAFFIEHQDELVRKHRGRTLVIRGERVEGVYDSTLDAYLDAQAKFDLGSYMIQRCEPGPGAYTVTVSSIHLA